MPSGPWFWLYLFLGPILWGTLVVLTRAGRRRMTRLMRDARRGLFVPEPAPEVVAVVPAKDEEAGIADCVRGILAQDYPRLRVVVVDDRSTDRTGEILDELAADVPGDRLVVRHVTGSLPPGWIGKPHALHSVTASWPAEEPVEWWWFVDSDVTLHPSALSQCVAISHAREYDALSLMTALRCENLSEKWLLPLAATTWATTFAISHTNDDNRPTRAAANGQFMLIRKEAYDAVGGHAAVPDKTCEDVYLFRLMKKTGRRVRLLLGDHLATTRMHTNWSQLVNGWARSFAGTAERDPTRLIIAAVLLSLSLLGLITAIIAGLVASPWWLVLAAVHWLAMSGWATFAYRGARQPVWRAVAFPLLIPPLVVLLANGIRKCFGGTVTWRGTIVEAAPR